jgi:type IV secretion system protein VirD4
MSLFDDFPRGKPNQSSRNAPLGTASWSMAAPAWKEGDLWLGPDGNGNAIGMGDDRHAMTIAGSRSGKGRSVIIPNLLLWSGSCVVIDPKGENATHTAVKRSQRSGHKVVVLDPKGAADIPDNLRVSFNPLDLIDGDADDAIDLASAIGDAVMIDSGDGKDIHWTESARSIVEALILHVATTEFGVRRSLVRVRQFLTLGDPDYAESLNADEKARNGDKAREFGPFDALWRSMSSSLAANMAVRDMVVGAAHSIRDMGENEKGSVLSTARRNTAFLNSTWMRQCLEPSFEPRDGNTLDIDALKSAPHGLSVYVCLPARFIPTHARFLRLILNLILYRMEAQGLDQPACGYPVLFLIDEFAALGRIEIIEKAAGLMAGYGVKLWPFLQDLGQLKRHYRESWETFLGNAGVLQFFANADMTTLDWLSKRLGQVELIRETRGTSDTTTTQISKSQGRTDTKGWSHSNGTSTGQSEMPDLSRLSARDGGSGGQNGLVPFLARSNASGTGHSEGSSHQHGVSGGESVQHGDSSSSGTSTTATTNEGIHQTPLLNADEIARLFDRRTGRQIVFIDNAPVALKRTNWDEENSVKI